ncbi:Acyl-CoA N-acyltransferase [Senna tora]|uniref:Acyl-CoA N-acyltransferase n=1 Tax=Senna tora TaxID=362788 RepID=A0A834X4N4_9FABA|nr:Acyl-CoA N-acyltransferase [Senna tora]
MPPMSTISIHRSKLIHSFFFNGHQSPTIAASCATTMADSKFFPKMKNSKEELSISMPPAFDKVETRRSDDLRFDRLQPSDRELVGDSIFEFGQFVARQAMVDEEYWAAAWLRAENYWENPTCELGHEIRFIHNYKMNFADKEFHALKKRCGGQNDSTCIIAVKKEQKNVKRPILRSVVGTLDLNILYLLQGESFPGERENAPRFCSLNRTELGRYAYIANLIVAKSARRQGIASNMLRFAVESAKSKGVKQVYMHVERNNKTAQMLYQKIGFELPPLFQMVEMANSQLLQQKMFLLRLLML